MALKVLSAVTGSGNHHIQIRKYTESTVSTGLANENTYFLGQKGHPNVPIYTDEIRITIRGSFSAAGSGSAGFGIDVSPDSSSNHWINLASASGNFQSVYPAHVGECYRITVREGSAASVSVDAWIS